MTEHRPGPERGVVYLVGAGPGDPGLVTKRGLDLIERADVIVHDRLVSPQLLERAPERSELVYAGKDPNSLSTAQDAINELLVARAREGKLVVRLKGGDPFVFGRGGEEAEALAQAAVRFEVVPGITAGIAAAAYAGIPLTHREQASAVAFVTGHEDPLKDESALDWSAIAAFPGTLVFYMGVRNLTELATKLIEHGRPRAEPAAVIERGSLPGQRTVTAPLAEIAQHAAVIGIRPPAVTVVGEVAGLRERLAWFEEAPLQGKRVAVTRARAQASTLAARLSNLGAEVIELPSIRIEPRLDDSVVREAVSRLAGGRYDVVCLTSPNGARLLLEKLGREGFDAGVLADVTIAAIGPGTTEALAEGGIEAEVVPGRSVAESLVEELVERGVDGRRVLIARASEARELLPESLEKAGASVDVVALYDTVREDLSADSVADLVNIDYVTFTSSSTVRYFVEALGGVERFPNTARVVSIGPVTSATAQELGLRVDAEAEQHDIDGLVTALVADCVAASD
jgi:uroporphyrinogen III methyltransferase/synthase